MRMVWPSSGSTTPGRLAAPTKPSSDATACGPWGEEADVEMR